MSQPFSERLERAIGEYVRACIEFTLNAGSAEAVNTTGDALRKLINDDRDVLLGALGDCVATLEKAVCGEPVMVGPALTTARAAINKATGLE
jgi:hypothetical protein